MVQSSMDRDLIRELRIDCGPFYRTAHVNTSSQERRLRREFTEEEINVAPVLSTADSDGNEGLEEHSAMAKGSFCEAVRDTR